jgi:hypothetical protein
MIDEKQFKTVSRELEDPENWNVFYSDEWIGRIRLVTRESHSWFHWETDYLSSHEDNFKEAYEQVKHEFTLKYNKCFSFVKRFNHGKLIYLKDEE